MPCYYVLIHGVLDWLHAPFEPQMPRGFYCHHHVLAASEARATEIALARVRRNLYRQTGWLSAGNAVLALEAEEIRRAPLHKLLWPANRGHAFYAKD